MLAAQACNIGIEPVVDPKKSGPDIRQIGLGATELHSIRNTDSRQPVPFKCANPYSSCAVVWWGEVSSADGLRFVVPVRTLNAGPNSKYFHVERGVTY